MQHHPPPTIAILGADTVVGSALCALLEGHGYRTVPIDAHPTGIADELLKGADLLLVGPRLNEGAREAFLGAVGKSLPRNEGIPVIALRSALDKTPLEGTIGVPWPCETRVLVERIEAALLEASEATTASTTQSRTG